MSVVMFKESFGLKKMNELFINAGVEGLTTEIYELFAAYADLLLEWNSKINLTRIVQPEEIAEKHFLDSILLSKYFDLNKVCSNSGDDLAIDVGTGAGFPSIPLLIWRKEISFCLLDSLNKRLLFLNELIRELKLSDRAKTLHMRAEDGGKEEGLREKFSLVTARAVAGFEILIEYCMPYVKIGGYFVAMKGPSEEYNLSGELLKKLGGEIVDVINYRLPCGDHRTLIIIEKISKTIGTYPRHGSKIIKKNK